MRYVEQYKLLSPTPDNDELIISTTMTNRTIQSAYAEVMGMYPPTELDPKKNEGSKPGTKDLYTLNVNQLVSIMDKENASKQRKVLPFKSRRYAKIQEKLMDQTLPDGFSPIPVYAKVHKLYAGQNDVKPKRLKGQILSQQ